MEIRLSQSQTQKLVLSPQIQQYLKLLQLPILDLTTAIDQELIENPVLEDATADDDEEIGISADQTGSEESDNESPEELEFQKKIDILEKLDDEFRESYFSGGDTKLESIDDLEKKQSFKENLITRESSFNEHLNAQLPYLELSEDQYQVAEEMIGNLDEDGYYRQDLAELEKYFNVPSEDLKDLLSLLQTLDPAGVFGTSLREVLMLQLERKDASPTNKLAYQILDIQFDNFQKREYSQIAKHLDQDMVKLEKALEVLRALEPKPGRIFFEETNSTVVPDVNIYAPDDPDDDYIIEILDDSIPRLRISKYYTQLAKDKSTDKETREYIKQKINAGFWFMKAIEQRKSTLRLIVEEIVKVQYEFFEKGFASLKPLTLKEIGERVEIHESTVSRALSGKYVNTPQGTIPFKSFFSNKIATDDGEFESQKSVMERLKSIVGAEDPKKPLSDSKLTKLMNEEGYTIARRTVAKYRELMKILPSHLRRVK